MAVKAVGASDRGPQCLRHAHAVAKGRSTVALFHSGGLFGNVFFHHFRVALKAAISNDDSTRTPLTRRAIVMCNNSHALAILADQRLRLGAAHQRATALDELRFERTQQYVAAAPFPIQTGAAASRRCQHPLVVLGRAGAHEFDAFALQPLNQFGAAVRHQAREIVLHKSIGGFKNQLVQQFGIQRDFAQAQVKRAAGVARVTQILFSTALFEDNRFSPQLRCAIGGYQPGNAATNDNQVCTCGVHVNI